MLAEQSAEPSIDIGEVTPGHCCQTLRRNRRWRRNRLKPSMTPETSAAEAEAELPGTAQPRSLLKARRPSSPLRWPSKGKAPNGRRIRSRRSPTLSCQSRCFQRILKWRLRRHRHRSSRRPRPSLLRNQSYHLRGILWQAPRSCNDLSSQGRNCWSQSAGDVQAEPVQLTCVAQRIADLERENQNLREQLDSSERDGSQQKTSSVPGGAVASSG